MVENELIDLTKGKKVDIKKVKGEKDVYRIRVGKYRILLKKVSKKKEIFVINIAHRKEAYR